MDKTELLKVFIFYCLFAIAFTVFFINLIFVNPNILSFGFDPYVIRFTSDDEVKKIAGLCQASPNPVECVYYNIPFEYDEYRAEFGGGNILSPTQLIQNKGRGVCRDIATFRLAVFKSMQIPAEPVITINHVYVWVKYNNTLYELNNNLLIKKEV